MYVKAWHAIHSENHSDEIKKLMPKLFGCAIIILSPIFTEMVKISG